MKKGVKEKRDLKSIFLLGCSSFFNDVGSEMITPILPFYITALGGTGVAVGLISGMREGLASLFKFFGGWFSDRIGRRKPFVFLGYFLSSIFKLLLGFVHRWELIVSLVSLERFGKLRDAPRDALIADSTDRRGEGFGFHQMMDTAGGILGTLIIIFFFWKLHLSIRTIIFIAAGIAAISLLPLFFVRDIRARKIKENPLKGIKHLDSKLKYFLVVASIFTLANFGLYLFLILRAKELTGSVIIPLIIYAIFSFVYAVSVIPFGELSDKIGRKKVLLGGYILFFLVSVAFICFQNFTALVVLFILYGLVYALTQANQRALVSDLAGNRKGTAMGFYSSVVGIVNVIGGLVAGILWDISYTTMFIYIAIIAFISIFLLLFLKEKGIKPVDYFLSNRKRGTYKKQD